MSLHTEKEVRGGAPHALFDQLFSACVRFLTRYSVLVSGQGGKGYTWGGDGTQKELETCGGGSVCVCVGGSV